MEYLQYYVDNLDNINAFKVLNLVISGIPSIQKVDLQHIGNMLLSFKPCYKWNTFNTLENVVIASKRNTMMF